MFSLLIVIYLFNLYIFFLIPFFSIGSLGKDGKHETVEFVHVKDVSFTGTTNGARIKTWQVIYDHYR